MSPSWLRDLVKWRGWRIIVSVAAVAYIVWIIDFQQIIQTMIHADWVLVLAAAGIYTISVGVRTLRWFLLIRHREKVPFLLLLQLSFVGMLGATFLPSSAGEDAIRITILSRHMDSAADAISATLLERVTGLVALAACAGLGTWQLRHVLAGELGNLIFNTEKLQVVAIILGGVLLAALVAWQLPWARQFRERLASVFHKVQKALDAYLANPRLLVATTLISFALPLGTILANYLVTLALRIPVSLASISVVVPVILALASLPISLGNGLGLREGLYVLMFQAFGVLPEQALALALVTRVLLVMVTLIGALPSLLLGSHTPTRPRVL